MKRISGCLIICIAVASFSCGGGGEGGSGSGALTPKGEKCGIAPPGPCEIDEKRSDEQRFEGLNELSKEFFKDTHVLHNVTLVGGVETDPLASHVRSIGIVMSHWDLEENANDKRAARRMPDGDLYPITQRTRCAADRLIELGADANPNELVCWSLELWRVGRAYTRMAAN